MTAERDEPLVDLLPRLSTHETEGRVVVFDHGALVGIVAPTDVARATAVGGLRPPRTPAPEDSDPRHRSAAR